MFCTNCGAPVATGAAFCPACGSRMLSEGPPPQFATTLPMDYATWGNRAIGYLIDSLLVGIAMAILYGLLGGLIAAVTGVGGRGMAQGVCCFSIVLFPLASLLVGLYNRVYLISQRGYSIGQGVVHVKVVDANGGLLTQGTAFLRLLVAAGMGLVPFLPVLDLLWPLWDDRRQTLHDKAVNCYVVNNR
jgi:uncharacterized RDD family membrane protein YckC